MEKRCCYKTLCVKYKESENFAELVELLKEYSRETGLPIKRIVEKALTKYLDEKLKGGSCDE